MLQNGHASRLRSSRCGRHFPLSRGITLLAGDADLQEVYDTERRLLYVACTRARDHVSVRSVEPASAFLEDLVGSGDIRHT